MSHKTDTSRSDTPAGPAGVRATPAQLAHELNNLLDGSLRSVELAIHRLRDTTLDDTQRDALAKLESADRLLLRMIDVIDAWGNRPNSTDSTASGEETEATATRAGEAVVRTSGTLADALEHAMLVYGDTCDAHGITLAAVADPAITRLPADALYNVLSNAIKNAIESIELRRNRRDDPHGSDRIEVRIELDDEEVVLGVTDTGDGIAPKLLDKTGAFRFGVTTKDDGHGIGLGLCQQIARAMRGRLSLRNRSPRGAVLTLRFPRFVIDHS